MLEQRENADVAAVEENEYHEIYSGDMNLYDIQLPPRPPVVHRSSAFLSPTVS